MTEAWIRIEDWLRQHSPGAFGKLAGPAGSAAITAAQERLGVTFPVELVESLRRHDGLTEWVCFFPEQEPLSLDQIVEFYEIRMDVAEDVDGFETHSPNDEPWWSPQWFPFGGYDGDLQVVDARPGVGQGRLGLAPNSSGGDFSAAYPSLGAYLTVVADAFEAGGAVGVWHLYFAADGEIWWDQAGKTELNGEPLRPAHHVRPGMEPGHA
ncbi:hypothetical protein L3i22_074110 [Actinoplanes sp. L3-i22]|nr:hypothetical protein L3i22_074110 [Actinoplanes sp. L3-i22]